MLRLQTKAERIVGLTGTPTGNGLMDLFAEYRVLDRGERLGRFIGRYREAYFLPDKRSAQQVFTWKPRPAADPGGFPVVGKEPEGKNAAAVNKVNKETLYKTEG